MTSKIDHTVDAKTLLATAEKLFTQFHVTEQDETFFQTLIDEFSPSIDILNQLKQFHAWCIDQHPTRISNCRFRFRSWLVNTHNYQSSRKQAGRPYPLNANPKKD
jgi:hypothetical protein